MYIFGETKLVSDIKTLFLTDYLTKSISYIHHKKYVVGILLIQHQMK